jgi:hypothetical protein
VSPVKYELGIYIPEDGILHSHSRESLKSYIASDDFTRPVMLTSGFGITTVHAVLGRWLRSGEDLIP